MFLGIFQKLNLENKTDHFRLPTIKNFHGLSTALKMMPFFVTLVAYFQKTGHVEQTFISI